MSYETHVTPSTSLRGIDLCLFAQKSKIRIAQAGEWVIKMGSKKRPDRGSNPGPAPADLIDDRVHRKAPLVPLSYQAMLSADGRVVDISRDKGPKQWVRL